MPQPTTPQQAPRDPIEALLLPVTRRLDALRFRLGFLRSLLREWLEAPL